MRPIHLIIKDIGDTLKSMFEDNSGGISTMRVIAFLWMLILTSTWAFVAYKTQSIPDIPEGVLAVTGTLIGGKVIQRFGEKPEE